MRAACQEMTTTPAPSAAHHTAAPPAATARAVTAAAAAAAGRVATSRRLLRHGQVDQQGHAAVGDRSSSVLQHGDPGGAGSEKLALLARLRKAAALMYNVTGGATCFTLDMAGPGAATIGPWDYQVCTEFLGQELPYFPAGPGSMFWDQGSFDWQGVVAHCRQAWGVTPAKYHSLVQHGGTDWRGTTNIVLSNGLYDPWSAFGVMADVSDSVVAVRIPDGAHHSDLMYARPDDSAALTEARATIMQHVRRWVEGHSPQARR
ncbi:serine carboxypeptidase S28-domain-containing protein [Scenedesmus sp. NREL 46B-D3]|nr:serine carboxypeptidase S28-domain-containing protein [Scenedesmus sp. NREL 46B-D3]